MSSLLVGTDSLICARLGIKERRHLGHLTRRIEPLSDSAALDLVEALYRRIAANLPDEASSPSNPLWTCRRVTSIGDGNRPDTMRFLSSIDPSLAIIADVPMHSSSLGCRTWRVRPSASRERVHRVDDDSVRSLLGGCGARLQDVVDDGMKKQSDSQIPCDRHHEALTLGGQCDRLLLVCAFRHHLEPCGPG